MPIRSFIAANHPVINNFDSELCGGDNAAPGSPRQKVTTVVGNDRWHRVSAG
jgi:hypothetical protein